MRHAATTVRRAMNEIVAKGCRIAGHLLGAVARQLPIAEPELTCSLVVSPASPELGRPIRLAICSPCRRHGIPRTLGAFLREGGIEPIAKAA
jgi:hypothetical protein